MKAQVKINIDSSLADIWSIITDIKNLANHIRGIEKIEIHKTPTDGLVGLRWTETRIMFGKVATETMWITDLRDKEYYKTRAESHGYIYETSYSIIENADQVCLMVEFRGQAQSILAKLLAGLFSLAFKKMTEKALYEDLLDIKRAVEKKS